MNIVAKTSKSWPENSILLRNTIFFLKFYTHLRSSISVKAFLYDRMFKKDEVKNQLLFWDGSEDFFLPITWRKKNHHLNQWTFFSASATTSSCVMCQLMISYVTSTMLRLLTKNGLETTKVRVQSPLRSDFVEHIFWVLIHLCFKKTDGKHKNVLHSSTFLVFCAQKFHIFWSSWIVWLKLEEKRKTLQTFIFRKAL